METTVFEFKLTNNDLPEESFLLSSDGHLVEYEGSDRNGEEQFIFFALSADDLALLRQTVEPELLKTRQSETTPGLDTGSYWSMKIKQAGFTIRQDGFFSDEQESSQFKQVVLSVLDRLIESAWQNQNNQQQLLRLKDEAYYLNR